MGFEHPWILISLGILVPEGTERLMFLVSEYYSQNTSILRELR
jgi:hypothetical protein